MLPTIRVALEFKGLTATPVTTIYIKHINRRKHMQRLCRLCLRIRTIIFFPAYHIWQQMYIVVIFPTAADSAENPGQVRRHTTTTPICGLSDLADSHRRGGGCWAYRRGGGSFILQLSRVLPTSVTNCVTLRKLMSHVCASSKCLEHHWPPSVTLKHLNLQQLPSQAVAHFLWFIEAGCRVTKDTWFKV